MEQNIINTTLRSQARTLGLCDQWFNNWKDNTADHQLADMFYRGIDFCIQHRFPSIAFIRENFPINFLRQKGIIANDSYSLLNPANAAIIGNSKATIRANAWAKPLVYALDNSTLTVEAKGNSTVYIHAFDNIAIKASTQDLARIVIFLHTKNATINADGSVSVREELNYLAS